MARYPNKRKTSYVTPVPDAKKAKAAAKKSTDDDNSSSTAGKKNPPASNLKKPPPTSLDNRKPPAKKTPRSPVRQSPRKAPPSPARQIPTQKSKAAPIAEPPTAVAVVEKKIVNKKLFADTASQQQAAKQGQILLLKTFVRDQFFPKVRI